MWSRQVRGAVSRARCSDQAEAHQYAPAGPMSTATVSVFVALLAPAVRGRRSSWSSCWRCVRRAPPDLGGGRRGVSTISAPWRCGWPGSSPWSRRWAASTTPRSPTSSRASSAGSSASACTRWPCCCWSPRVRRDRTVWVYVVPQAAIGAAHRHRTTRSSRPSPTRRRSAPPTTPCTTRYVWEFGFVSLPFMALVGLRLHHRHGAGGPGHRSRTTPVRIDAPRRVLDVRHRPAEGPRRRRGRPAPRPTAGR